jgi:hypothetical protein
MQCMSRARRKSVSIWVLAGFASTCSRLGYTPAIVGYNKFYRNWDLYVGAGHDHDHDRNCCFTTYW